MMVDVQPPWQSRSADVCAAIDKVMGQAEAAERLADVIIFTITQHLPDTVDQIEVLKIVARRILCRTKSSTLIMLAALTYTDRYFASKSPLDETSMLIAYQLFLGTLITAHKYFSDVSLLNTAWLEVCGDKFTIEDLNSIERQFLKAVDYDLGIEDTETQNSWLETIQVLTESTDSDRYSMNSSLKASRSISTMASLGSGLIRNKSVNEGLRPKPNLSSRQSSVESRARRRTVSGSRDQPNSVIGFESFLNCDISTDTAVLLEAFQIETRKISISSTPLHSQGLFDTLRIDPKIIPILDSAKNSSKVTNEPVARKKWKGWKQFWKQWKKNGIEVSI